MFWLGNTRLSITAALAAIAFVSPAAPAQTALPAGLVSQDRGVVANRVREACYDRYGVFIGLTAVFYRPLRWPAGQTAETRAIIYGEWQWLRTHYSNNSETRTNQPERYVVRFEPEGVLTAKIDCNTASGSYRLEKNRLIIGLINSTLMACEPGSLERVFQHNLAAAVGYFMKNGQLFLRLKHNSGTMEFGRPASRVTPLP